ncbi:hypothetical protein DLM45_12055 [Hyphomicrobium methylovorum]|uniref:hypothetical protein n=1 Tax=Hyphomicrobium methylovorum TaxID=84 RepID=UPI0015E79513|nr:hypothetical protein [Hyphomicrobium methylovorum]MBA2126947.1 hypothetical protein [Hyphomicrobium methylovorum]
MQTIANTVPHHQTLSRPLAGRFARALGLGIATLVPAALWAVLISAVASWIGSPLAYQTVVITAIAIAVFLGLVCAPLILRLNH